MGSEREGIGYVDLERLESKIEARLKDHDGKINDITVQLASIGTKLNFVLTGLGAVCTAIVGMIVKMWF